MTAALDEAGIANARLRTPAELTAHPQLRARDGGARSARRRPDPDACCRR